MARHLKLRVAGTGKKGKYPIWQLTVPTHVSKQIEDKDKDELLFDCEMVPEGILYRVVGRETLNPTEGWPSGSN